MKQEQQFNISVSIQSEIIFLLRKNQPNNCNNWIEGIGDCMKDGCEFCRIEKCINAIESIEPLINK